jgi:hypothetical protein
MRVLLCLGLATVLLAAPASAQAVSDDVRCLLVSNAFAATEKDVPRKQLAVESAHFFLGRIDAKLTQPQLKAQILQIAKTLRPDTMAATMNACVKRVQSRQQMMQVIGGEIKAAQPKPAPGAVKK